MFCGIVADLQKGDGTRGHCDASGRLGNEIRDEIAHVRLVANGDNVFFLERRQFVQEESMPKTGGKGIGSSHSWL